MKKFLQSYANELGSSLIVNRWCERKGSNKVLKFFSQFLMKNVGKRKKKVFHDDDNGDDGKDQSKQIEVLKQEK